MKNGQLDKINGRILFIGGNFAPEPTGIGKYNGELIEWLTLNGYECKVITTYPYYPHWKVHKAYGRSQNWFKQELQLVKLSDEAESEVRNISITRCPHFVPANPSGLKRIISEFSFSVSAIFAVLPLLFTKKYDFVFTVAPPFQIGLLGVLYKKVKGAKFLYHLQDLQIDAAAELNMIQSAPLLKVLYKTEKFILKHSDTVSTISEGMIKRVKGKYNKEVYYFPNWTDLDFFHPVPDRMKAKERFGFKADQKIILYSGAIGEKQGLEAILYVAKQFENRKDLIFIIAGSGPYKNKLEQLQQQLGLQNIVFMPVQRKRLFNLFLNAADVHLVLQKSNAGDLVMPSKLTSILSVGGLAIVTANADTTLYNLLQTEKIGLLAQPENLDSLANTIRYAIDNDMEIIKTNARTYAEQQLSSDEILMRYSTDVLKDKHTKKNF